jgi:hypothetical protein
MCTIFEDSSIASAQYCPDAKRVVAEIDASDCTIMHFPLKWPLLSTMMGTISRTIAEMKG